MSTSDFIDAEMQYYNSIYNPSDPNAYLRDPTNPRLRQPSYAPSTVFEIMNDQKMGKINAAEATSRLTALRNNDIRRDLTKYVMRNQVNQNYSINLSGGTEKMSHNFSARFDKTQNNTVRSDNDRLTLDYSLGMQPLKNLTLNGAVGYYTSSTTDQSTLSARVSANTGSLFLPYARLADDNGNPLNVQRNYSTAYQQLLMNTYGDKLLDMNYVPLKDIYEGYKKTRYNTLNLSANATYTFSKAISINLAYNYSKSLNKTEDFASQNSWVVRNLVNYYTDPSNNFNRSLSLGAIYNPSTTELENQAFYGNLFFNKEWKGKHAVNASVGGGVTEFESFNSSYKFYGYDQSTLNYQALSSSGTRVPVLYRDYTFFPLTANLPFDVRPAFSNTKTRTVSGFANAAYTYDRRYIVSASIRNDASSDFGYGTNKWGTPFYSAGLGWNINHEKFYHWNLVPQLKLRATYGYNGNANPLVSAVPLITSQTQGGGQYIRTDGGQIIPYGWTGSPNGTNDVTNSLLRPERTGMFNVGLDFGFKGNRISGSFEYYDKRTKDLMASAPVNPSTGYNSIVFNVADLHGWGTDFTLNTVNIKNNKFSWSSTFLFSYNRVKVTELYTDKPETAYQFVSGDPQFNKEFYLDRLFAYSWGGLDPQNGHPRGIIDGKPVTINDGNDYYQLQMMSGTSSSVKYFGSAVPVYFGSLRNTFTYGNLSVSTNLMYKLGYFFRRNSNLAVSYSRLFSTISILQGAEYAQRWQKPGDELHTNVPSLSFPVDDSRDNFYAYSEVNVLKGDHIRIQEVNLSYSFQKKIWLFKNASIAANLPLNIIIWRANKAGIDPDAQDYPIPRTYGFSFRTNL